MGTYGPTPGLIDKSMQPEVRTEHEKVNRFATNITMTKDLLDACSAWRICFTERHVQTIAVDH
jgi:hypothetical protein